MSLTIPDPTPDAPLFVFGDDSDWVIAHSAEDASVVWAAAIGEPHDDAEYPWVQLYDDAPVRIVAENGIPTTNRADEWVKIDGRGFLCSENY